MVLQVEKKGFFFENQHPGLDIFIKFGFEYWRRQGIRNFHKPKTKMTEIHASLDGECKYYI